MYHYNRNMVTITLRRVWIIGLISLICFNSVAIYSVSETTCGKPFIPILLSRALTTDPWRGMTLSYSLVAIAFSFTLNSSVLTTAFFGFFSAFLVSMFDTALSHDFLILTSCVLILFECMPRIWQFDLWTIHFLSIIVFSIICMTWMMYSKYSGTYTLHDQRCSWMFVTEYITIWLMNALVLWIIPSDMIPKDAICEEAKRTAGSAAEKRSAAEKQNKQNKTNPIEF